MTDRNRTMRSEQADGAGGAIDLSEASLYGDNSEILDTTSVGSDGLDDEVRELLEVRSRNQAKRHHPAWLARLRG